MPTKRSAVAVLHISMEVIDERHVSVEKTCGSYVRYQCQTYDTSTDRTPSTTFRILSFQIWQRFYFRECRFRSYTSVFFQRTRSNLIYTVHTLYALFIFSATAG